MATKRVSIVPPSVPGQMSSPAATSITAISGAMDLPEPPGDLLDGDSDGSGQDIAGLPSFSIVKTEFLTQQDSPFKDKYSISRERNFLTDYIAAGADKSDPRYDRYLELQRRIERIEPMKKEWEADRGAEPQTTVAERFGVLDLGGLDNEGADQLVIHTKSAYDMFLGRRHEPDKNKRGIIGGKRMGSVLRNLWVKTSHDNPYADWALVRHDHSMHDVNERIEREIKATEDLLADMKKRGIFLSVLSSRHPSSLTLGFRSPYGFAIVMLINRYDYFVRLQQTLKYKNIKSDDEVRQKVSEMTRMIRRVWYDTARFEQWLGMPEIKMLSRADFFSDADAEAQKRATFVIEAFGVVPSHIYSGAVYPRHSMRRRRVEPDVQKAIERTSQALEQRTDAADRAGTGYSGSAPGTDAL